MAGWLATVSRGGDLVWTGRGGYRDAARHPVADDTIWRLYSMTKPLTALAVMILFEEGRFDLNDDAATWIDALAEPRVYAGGSAESPETVAADAPVRVADLLTHSAGLTYGFQRRHAVDEIYRAKGYDFAWTGASDLAGAVDDWCSSPLVFQPGTHFNYSVASDVLGRLVEIWSGQGLDAFVAERILGPLGMSDTDWWCPPDKAERLATLYLDTPAGASAFDHLGRHALARPRILGGGGGLVGTAGDYATFMRLLLGGGEVDGVRVISRATHDLMTRNHLPGGADLATCAVDSYAEVGYAGLGYGYGGFVVLDSGAYRSPTSEGSFGWGGAATTVFWVDPAEDLAVAFYSQLFPTIGTQVRRELAALVYGALSD
ncbi:MAG: beta-lactamase family protein [Acidobacteriota bacterium]|nr:beta-lactamase family protein [Acidobacteriota bacterium]